MIYFTPARFDLWEFDAAEANLPEHRGDRWFSSWQGRVGFPAEEVVLGWESPGVRVLVSTSEPKLMSDRVGRRRTAAFLVLGGPRLTGGADAVATPADTHAEITRLSEKGDGVWSMAEISVDDRVHEVEVVKIGDIATVGNLWVGQLLVCFAAVGIDAAEMRLRSLTLGAANGYSVSPFRPATAAALNATARPLSPI